MTAQQPAPSTRGKALSTRPVDADAPIRWGCSGRGWHCCTGKTVPVRPYELIRLRHALGKPSEAIVNEAIVTFAWEPDGALSGYAAHVDYERDRPACIFYEEITNVRARELAEREPERLATLPEAVRRAARSTATGEWRVAGLCRVHAQRPEACRGFPFQRDPARERREHASPYLQVFHCGTCALATPTTPLAVMHGNDIEPFWRADDVLLAVVRYLHARGLANLQHPRYRALPVSLQVRMEPWVAMYAPDTNAAVRERFGEQWRADADPDGDEAIYRLLAEQTLDRADALVARCGLQPDQLGPEGAPSLARPDLDALLDRERPLTLPVVRRGAA